MTLENLIDNLVKWLESEVATRLDFKVPPQDGSAGGDDYTYQRIHPNVFPFFLPPDDEGGSETPAPWKTAPAIIVQVMDGYHNPVENNGSVNIRLLIRVWNPGFHQEFEFTRDGQGWRDLVLLMDEILMTIEKKRFLNGLYVRDGSLAFQFEKDSTGQNLISSYPYFSGEITFTVDFHKFIKPDFID